MFERHSIAEPGLVWDPTVHKFFGEDCFYLLLHLPETRSDLLRKIAALRTPLDLRSFAFYQIYGYFDVAIRVWTTQAILDDLIGRIVALVKADTAQVMVDPLVFRVKKLYFDGWAIHDEGLDTRSVAKHLTLLRRVGNASEIDLLSGKFDEDVDVLRRASLVHTIDPAAYGLNGLDLVKFYVALQGSRVTTDYLEEVEKLRSSLKEWQEHGVKLVSLYYGSADNSDIRSIVKGVVPVSDYPKIVNKITALADLIAKQGLRWRTTTLLVAESHPSEADKIDPNKATEPGSSVFDQQLSRLISGDSRAVLNASPYRDEIRSLFSRYAAELLETEFERYFLGILEAGIHEDVDLLHERLTFYTRIDGWVTSLAHQKLLPQLVEGGAMTKKRWEEELPSAIERANAGKKEKELISYVPGRSGMGDLVKLLGTFARAGDIDLSVLRGAVPTNWLSVLGSGMSDRNAFAHGALESMIARRGFGIWTGIAERSFAVGIVYNSLANHPELHRSRPK